MASGTFYLIILLKPVEPIPIATILHRPPIHPQPKRIIVCDVHDLSPSRILIQMDIICYHRQHIPKVVAKLVLLTAHRPVSGF